nr:hypothetical protein [Lentzea fradiae]
MRRGVGLDGAGARHCRLPASRPPSSSAISPRTSDSNVRCRTCQYIEWLSRVMSCGSESGVGSGVLSSSTGTTVMSRWNAIRSSVRTQSRSSSRHRPPFTLVMVSQDGPITASTTSARSSSRRIRRG